MAEKTGVSWTRSTWNPWIGCTKVSVTSKHGAGGCDHCYAELQDGRKIFGGTTHWGSGVPRLRTKDANWNQVRRWNRAAPDTEFAGRKGFWPVFCASLADIFDNEVPEAWRDDFWALVKECKNLTFQIVTKRVGNIEKMLPPDWGDGYPNVWLMISVVNQYEADRDIGKLMQIQAAKRCLSVEPLLGPIDLRHCNETKAGYTDWLVGAKYMKGVRGDEFVESTDKLDLVIVGGESTDNGRPMHPKWPRSLRDQCKQTATAFFFKQHGEWLPEYEAGALALSVNTRHSGPKFLRFVDGQPMMAVGTKASGCLLDGVLHNDLPGA